MDVKKTLEGEFARDSRSDIFVLFAGQLNDTQQELKENNELVVELQGDFQFLPDSFLFLLCS